MGHSITQSLNDNCACELIPWIYIWQWLKREKMSTTSSFMFAASVFEGHVHCTWTNQLSHPLVIEEQPGQCHVRCFFENTKVLICQTRICTREPPLVSHTTAVFCSLTFRECQRKKNARCVPAPTLNKLSFGSCVIVYWLTYSTKTNAAIRKICPYL